jgi:hypothetical protein
LLLLSCFFNHNPIAAGAVIEAADLGGRRGVLLVRCGCCGGCC